MHDVFISYKSSQYYTADKVRNALEAAGIRCWIAPDHIEGGQSYAKQIPNAIRNAKVFVVLLSKAAMESIWVSKELDSAINEHKRIMPFVLEDEPLTDEFQFYLSNIQQYRAFDDFDGTLARMIEDIRLFIGPTPEPMPEHAPEPEPVPEPAPKPATEPKPVPKSKPEPDPVPEPEPEPEPKKTAQPKPEPKPEPKREPEPKPEPKPNPKKKENPKKAKRFPLIPVIIGGIVLVAAVVGVILAVSGKNKTAGKTADVSSTDSASTDADVNSPYSAYINGNTFSASECTFTEDDLNEIAKIQEKKEIYSIKLDRCTIESRDLSALIGPNLTVLKLSGCGLDAEQIGSLPLANSKIQTLDLHDNPIGADAAITLPEKLSALDISDTGMSAECVRGLSLGELHMDGNGLQSLDAISDMKELRILFVCRNELISLDDLEKCINIRTLIAQQNNITSIEGLHNVTRLEKVDLSGNSVADISVLNRSAETLAKLDLSGNPVDTSTIKDVSFPNLTHLYMNGCGISDVGFFDSMPGLKYLYINDNPQIRTLPKNVHTVELYAENCGITGYAGAYTPDENEHYVRLNMRGNKMTGIYLSPNFNKDNRYTVLDLRDMTPDGNTAAMLVNVKGSVIAIGYSDLLDLKALKNNWYTIYLVGCPLDKELDVKDVLGYSVKFYETSADMPDDIK